MDCRRSTTHEFEISLDALQDEAIAFGGTQLQPFFLMGEIDECGVVLGPIHSCCLGVSIVVDIIDMACIANQYYTLPYTPVGVQYPILRYTAHVLRTCFLREGYDAAHHNILYIHQNPH